MKKTDAYALCDFMLESDDMVTQEDWFSLCDMLLAIIVEDGNKSSSTCWNLADKYPMFFRSKVVDG